MRFQVTGDYSEDEDPWNGRRRSGEEEEEGALEYFILQESTGYMAPALRCLAILHTIISFLCVVGYYYLKVPQKRPQHHHVTYSGAILYGIRILTFLQGASGRV